MKVKNVIFSLLAVFVAIGTALASLSAVSSPYISYTTTVQHCSALLGSCSEDPTGPDCKIVVDGLEYAALDATCTIVLTNTNDEPVSDIEFGEPINNPEY